MDLFPNNKYTSSPELTSLKEDSELEVIKNEEELQKKENRQNLFSQNKFDENPLSYTTLGSNPSVSEFENNPEVEKDATTVFEYFGNNSDRISEFLRDDIGTGTLISRAFKTTNAPDNVKQAYARLKTNFKNSELKTADEWIDAVKDISIDVLADPITILSLMFAPITGGVSAGGRAAITELLKKGVNRYTASTITKAGARPAILTGAEGAAWGGLHEYFNQDLDVDLQLRNKVDLKSVAGTSAITGLLGGTLGFLTGSLSGREYFKRQYKYFNPDNQIKEADSLTRKQIVDKELAGGNADLKSPDSLERRKDALISGFFGKATTQLMTVAKSSNTIDYILRQLRYDYGRTLFGSGFKETTEGDAKSYFEGLSILFGKTNGKMEQIFNELNRVTSWKHYFAPRITRKDNEAILELLQTDGAAKTFKYKDDVIDINDSQRTAFEKLKVVLDETFERGVDVGLFTENQRVSNYFPRLFSFDVLSTASGRQRMKTLLKKHGDRKDKDGKTIPYAANDNIADKLIDDMLELRYTPFEGKKSKGVGAGKGFLQHRAFSKIPDAELGDLINRDVTDVLTDYFTNANQAIERKRRFGLTADEFRDNFSDKIRKELGEAGGSRADIEDIVAKVENLVFRSTGIVQDRATTALGRFGTGASEWGRLFQQMAHLPLAVISSVTEPIIMLSRVGITDSPAAAGDIAKSMVKGVEKIMDRSIKGAFSAVTGKKVRFRDLDDEYWRELYDVGLALESATLDGLDRLASGDALTGKVAKGLQNLFFKANFLTQWTQAVQAASFVSAQKLIRRNSQKLYEDQIGARTLSTGNFRNLGVNQKEYLTKQLNELGIDENEAINWYRSSLNDDKVFDVNKSKASDFYYEKYLPGAGRFVNEVILNPSIAAANKPLLFSSPTGKLLFQFAGYPTAFNNIVLKRFINESSKYPMSASPKVLATALTMTTVAMIGNYIRSEGRAFENYEGKGKPAGEIIMDAYSRWGGLGALDYGRRISQNMKYGSGLLGSTIKGFTGPLPADFIDTLIYRKGIFDSLGSNIPGIGAADLVLGSGTRKELRSIFRELDKDLERAIAGQEKSNRGGSIYDRFNFRTGGPAVDVPNAPDKPEERVNKVTGVPYDLEAGPTAQPEKNRSGLSEEGKLLATLQRRQKKFTGGKETDNSLRLDGTKKSQVGWKGRIKNNVTGKIMTELSVGKPNTEEGFYPLINPYTTDKQIDFIQNFDFEKNNIFETKIGKQMNMNARKHYRESLEKNVSPFVNDK